MFGDDLVIDAVAHAYDFSKSNRVDTVEPEPYEGFITFIHAQLHGQMESTAPGYLLDMEEWRGPWHPEELASVFFEESDVDILVYHEVEIPGFFKRGSSPGNVGIELKRAYPDRVLYYAYVDPFRGPSELERMRQKVEASPVDGFKFYPADGLFDAETGQPRTMLYDDPEMAYPYFELARELGIPQIAIHKAFPVGPGSPDKDHPGDVSPAAVAFPDLTFEVVHSGWAFVEEFAMQLMSHPNVYANLESVANFAVRRPRKFAEIIGAFLQVGAEDRILFGTGASAGHPQPILEAFGSLEMPPELVEGYGYSEITPEIKSKILGRNMAALHGIEVDDAKERLGADGWAERRAAARERPVEPWHAMRERLRQTTTAA